MIGHLLCAVAAWSWIIEFTLPSVVLLGEYPYPSEEDN